MFSYRRWRHTRGFGVHSPFAFKLVSDILRLPARYGYYGYTDIEKVAAAERRKRHSANQEYTRKAKKEAKLFLRLVAFLNPGTLFLHRSEQTRLLHLAAMQADSHLRILTSEKNIANCRMICTSADSLELEVLLSHITRPGSIILIKDYQAETLKRLFEALPEGLFLYGQRNAILINRPGMMKVSYSIIL